jgi:hypothetical protein
LFTSIHDARFVCKETGEDHSKEEDPVFVLHAFTVLFMISVGMGERAKALYER